MNANFEFILGMYSIIAGLGVSRLLEGIRLATEPGTHRRAYWLQGVMVCLGLAVHATTWMSLWALRHVSAWNVRGFLLVLTVPALMYLFSASVLPALEATRERQDANPKARYFGHARRIHGLLAAALLTNALSELMVLGHVNNVKLTMVRVGLAALLATCACFPRNESLHRVLVPLIATIGVLMPILLELRVVE